MILIISQEEDYSTSEVIQWLLYYNAPFIRINREDVCSLDKIVIANSESCSFVISSKKGEISVEHITSVWYRRGEMNLHFPALVFIKEKDLLKEINKHLKEENAVLESFFHFLIEKIPHIGTYNMRIMNKLSVLHEAQKLKIEIPYTFIVNNSNGINCDEALVTKSISEAFDPRISQGNYMTYTEGINPKNNSISFFPSLFQRLVEKEADIRIFYLQQSFYAMAIRSQDHPQTKTDFRKYLFVNPNRHFPFKIPGYLEEKLSDLMQNIGLETGSIDMVFTKDGHFVFLEVNPIGQFGMTSKPCNYFLERELALSLIKLSKQLS